MVIMKKNKLFKRITLTGLISLITIPIVWAYINLTKPISTERFKPKYDISFLVTTNRDEAPVVERRVEETLGKWSKEKVKTVEEFGKTYVIFDLDATDEEEAKRKAKDYEKILRKNSYFKSQKEAVAVSISSVGDSKKIHPLIAKYIKANLVGKEYAAYKGYNSKLERLIYEKIDELKTKKVLENDENLSILFYDFLVPYQRPVQINVKEKRIAASAIKPMIVLAHRLKKGENGSISILDIFNYFRALVFSSNATTNKLITELGGPKKVTDILKNLQFSQTIVKENIPEDGRTYENKTSIGDLFEFYYTLMYYMPGWKFMVDFLRLTRTKFSTDNGITINKTGTVFGSSIDAGLIIQKKTGVPYFFGVIIENKECAYSSEIDRDKRFRTWKTNKESAIKELSELVDDYVETHYYGTTIFGYGTGVLVDKSERKAYYFENGNFIAVFNVSLGSKKGKKEKKGDKKTPTGVYYVTEKKESSFNKFIELSYPNKEDAARGLLEYLISEKEYYSIIKAINNGKAPPQNTKLGGKIGLHGKKTIKIFGMDVELYPLFINWTNGCIAFDNSAIDSLYNKLEPGTIVQIQE